MAGYRRKMCFRGCTCELCEQQRETDRRYAGQRTADPLTYPSQLSTARRARKYRLDLEELQAMRNAQQDRCAICGKEETVLGSTGKVKSLAIDHCHATGRIRGLLCNNCNRGIGLLGKEPGLLRRALEYMEDPNA